MMVMFVAFPTFHVLGVTAVTLGKKESPQFCAWQIAGENRMKAAESSRKCVAAWRSGPTIAPQFTQGLAHGCDPFVGWLRAGSEKRLGGNIPQSDNQERVELREDGTLVMLPECGLVSLSREPSALCSRKPSAAVKRHGAIH